MHVIFILLYGLYVIATAIFIINELLKKDYRNPEDGSHVPPCLIPPQQEKEGGLRAALLKCSTLTEAEVNEYIAYEFGEVEYEDVPLDYELEHPEAEISTFYSDGIAQAKVLRKHRNQISLETLEKVQRVLPLLL